MPVRVGNGREPDVSGNPGLDQRNAEARNPCRSGCGRYLGVVNDDTWASADLAGKFADEAYATVKGYVRTYVLHHQLLGLLPPPPATVLDVGGGAGHQSFPLAQAGYEVTLLDSSPPMLDKARQRLQRLPVETQRRVALVQADGENAEQAMDGRRFAVVLCHGVLGYLEPEPLIGQLCRCVDAGGLVSIMAGNARTMALRPALERRWEDALASFDATTGIVGELGVRGRSHAVEEVSEHLRSHGVEPLRWYGTWLWADLLEFSGVELDPADPARLASMAEVELEASRRDPYRQLSRAFHLVGSNGPK